MAGQGVESLIQELVSPMGPGLGLNELRSVEIQAWGVDHLTPGVEQRTPDEKLALDVLRRPKSQWIQSLLFDVLLS